MPTVDNAEYALDAQEEARREAAKHGRSADLPPDHPINALPRWRKFAILCTLALAGYLGNLIIAIVMTAFGKMGAAFDVPPNKIADTIGYNLLGIAVGSLFWNPLSKSLGRHPVYIGGSFLFLFCCIWLALSKTFTTFVVARVFTGIVSSWSQTLPATTVADIFIPEVRGSKMSLLAIAVVSSPTTASFWAAIIANKGTWQDIFWFCLGLGGLQLLLFVFVVPETLWNWDDNDSVPKEVDAKAPVTTTTDGDTLNNEKPHISVSNNVTDQNKQHVSHFEDPKQSAHHSHHHIYHAPVVHHKGHVGPAWYPWKRPGEYLRTFVSPIVMVHYFVITVPSFYYGLVWAWSVGQTVVTSVILEEPPYHFKPIPIGCAMLALAIGGILGKWSGGVVADKTVGYFERRHGRREPEDRIWALLPMIPLLFIGLVIFGVCAEKELHWMGLLVTGAIYYFALSGTTGILQTYVMECYLSRSQDTQANFIFWKAMWGFAVSFFAIPWGEKEGWLGAYGIQGALVAGFGLLLCAGLLWKGKAIRQWQGMPDFNAPI